MQIKTIFHTHTQLPSHISLSAVSQYGAITELHHLLTRSTVTSRTSLHGTLRTVTVPGAIGPSFHDLLSQTRDYRLFSGFHFQKGVMTPTRLCQMPGSAVLVRMSGSNK
jgi:hypothetical protein